MVKFSKQLESQLIPEWKSAFCNYWQLKKDLKPFKLSQGKKPNHANRKHFGTSKDVLIVRAEESGNSNQNDHYKTELLEPIHDSEPDNVFFEHLDAELNKVNSFYKKKEDEYLRRGQEIKAQLEKLLQLRTIMALHQGRLSSEINVNEIPSPPSLDRSHSSSLEDTSSIPTMQLNIPRSTMIFAVAPIIQVLWDDAHYQTKNGENSLRKSHRLDKKKVHYAGKMLRAAFVEFYRGLGLLRTFSNLNLIAFTKILKKYDKLTGRNASSVYMKVVEKSYFQISDKVAKEMAEVERDFIKYFTEGNRKKGMSLLRPVRQKSSHKITFFLGAFTGCSIAFVIAFVILLHLQGFDLTHLSYTDAKDIYMDSVFPVFSIMLLIVIHLYMYGWNLYIWREKRINYAFIFEFATNTEMKYREVLLVSSALTVVIVAGMIGHYMAFTNPSITFNTAVIPLSILLFFMLLLCCPLKIFHWSSRLFFLSSMKRIILSPLYKVVMADFFLADQLTSQVHMFRNMEYVTCYYVATHLRSERNDVCISSNITFEAFAYLVSLLPYWWRLMQCLRRWNDEKTNSHLANGGKYFSAMVAAALALTYRNKRTTGWMIGYLGFSMFTTGYQLYWDFIVDWGLLRPRSKNFLLRDELMLEKKYVYFLSMALNFVLRLAWLQSVTRFEVLNIDRRITDLVFASLEVVRRGHWNFYRLENEHLNNVGRFRAVKTVPLPFRELEHEV